MISITQNLETPAFSALVDPECASLLRQNDLTPPPATETKLAWQVAPSRGAVKDRLLKDDTVRLVLIAIEEEADPLLRDLARNIGQIRGRAWLHAVLVTRDRVTPPLLAQLRNFASWSVLALPCSADELSEILLEASAKAADQHRLAMLSTAIRAEAEDLLVRTRNIVGALQNVSTPAALGNLVSIADRLSGGLSSEAGFPHASQQAPAPHVPAQQRSYPATDADLFSPEEAGRNWVRMLIDLCAARQNHFPDGLFCDPAWDMLLDLTYARLTGKRVSVSSLCIASRVPATTALRRIGDLVAEGLAMRVRDENDGRRVFVDLTDDGYARMLAYIEYVRGTFASHPRSSRKA
ncbi:MAG: MarR family transcriptional regulator [Parvibaculum sp.]|jgi:hypothetical protein|nr:MarR family transcriptional regulator [Parvibaculum sp.]